MKNRNSLENLIVEQLPYLHRVALSFTKNVMAADDLLQDTLAKIWSHQDKFVPGSNFKAFKCNCSK